MDPKRIETNVKPQVIERLGNNTYYYNYDIKEKVVTVVDMDKQEKTETRWDYIQVQLSGYPNLKDCIRAIIRSYVTQDEEFDLINSANKLLLGMKFLPEDREKYLNYLKLVAEIKSKVKLDFNK